jgi:hypothetical protein
MPKLVSQSVLLGSVGSALRAQYDELRSEPIPENLVALVQKLSEQEQTSNCHSPGCHRSGDASLDGFPDDMAIPDIAPLLKCSACGGKRITVMTNMREYYAICRARKLGVP